jgi:putative ABC transport system permease protein
MWLLESLAALALLLSAVGIYSVISYSVTQQTHEIGIRMALGASHGDVAGLVVRQGVVLASIGLAAGWLGTLALGRFFSSLPFEVRWLLLFDVRPADPLVMGTVSAILALVALLSCYIPARRGGQSRPHRGAAVRVIGHRY